MYWFLLIRPLTATFFAAWYGIPMRKILRHHWDWEQEDDITPVTLRRSDVPGGSALHQAVHDEAAESAERAPLAVLQPVARPPGGWPSLRASQDVRDRAADSAERAPLGVLQPVTRPPDGWLALRAARPARGSATSRKRARVPRLT
jgi:hypothetical protein